MWRSPTCATNLEALKDVVRFIYDNIQYAEFNTKSDYCQCCGYDGEIEINEDFQWECPVCHNKDQRKMNVTPPYLRISRRKLLERRQNQRNQSARLALVNFKETKFKINNGARRLCRR